jgi:hypothetical protein
MTALFPRIVNPQRPQWAESDCKRLLLGDGNGHSGAPLAYLTVRIAAYVGQRMAAYLTDNRSSHCTIGQLRHSSRRTRSKKAGIGCWIRMQVKQQCVSLIGCLRSHMFRRQGRAGAAAADIEHETYRHQGCAASDDLEREYRPVCTVGGQYHRNKDRDCRH